MTLTTLKPLSVGDVRNLREAAESDIEHRNRWLGKRGGMWARRALQVCDAYLDAVQIPEDLPEDRCHDVHEYDGDTHGPWMGFVVEGHVPPLQLLLAMAKHSDVNCETLTDHLLARGYDPLWSLPLILEHIRHAHLKEAQADEMWEPEDEDDTPDMVWEYVDAPEAGTRPVTVFELQTIELHTAQHPRYPATALPIEQLLGLRRMPEVPVGFSREEALREWAIKGRGASGALHKMVKATTALVQEVDHTRQWAAQAAQTGDIKVMQSCLESIANPKGYEWPDWYGL